MRRLLRMVLESRGYEVCEAADVSFDSLFDQGRWFDGFGHGTHMAGIIAGKDPAGLDPERFLGVAPDARLFNVKVGASDGGVADEALFTIDRITGRPTTSLRTTHLPHRHSDAMRNLACRSSVPAAREHIGLHPNPGQPVHLPAGLDPRLFGQISLHSEPG